MAYCVKCGAAAGATQKFCLKCGQPLDQARTTIHPGSSAPQKAAYPPEGGYPQGTWTPTRPPSSRKWLWLTLGGLVVAAAIGLVLGLVVFGGGAGPAAAPEETVRRALAAAEKEDMDSLFSLLSPALKREIAADFDGPAFENIKDRFGEYLRIRFSVKFSDAELVPVESGPSNATVELARGTVVVTDHADDYQSGVYDIYREGGSDFYLIKVGGLWYIDGFDEYWEVVESGSMHGETTTTTAAPATTAPPITAAPDLEGTGIFFEDLGNHVVKITDVPAPGMVFPVTTSGDMACTIEAFDAAGSSLGLLTTVTGVLDYSSVAASAAMIVVTGPTGAIAEYVLP
jgi:hypothetical protein